MNPFRRSLIFLVIFFFGLPLQFQSADGIPVRPEKEEIHPFIDYSTNYYKDVCLLGNDPCRELGIRKEECYFDDLFPCRLKDSLKPDFSSSELSCQGPFPSSNREFYSWLEDLFLENGPFCSGADEGKKIIAS